MTVPEADLDDDLIGRRQRPPAPVVMPLAMLGAVLLFGVPLAKSIVGVRDPQPAATNRMTLIASPNEPLMVQSIRYAQAHRAEDGPWGGAQRKQGPTATFQTPAGSITMTQTEIADANAFYPQLVGRAKSANR